MDHAISTWTHIPRRHPVWTVSVAMLLAVVATLALLEWNWAKGPVQGIGSHMMGRELRIDGDLDVDFFPLEVHAERLQFSNATWAGERVMARTEQLDMQVRFWPLLIGRVVLPDLALDRPYLRLERNTEGMGNWVFRPGQRSNACARSSCSRLRIGQLHVRDGQFVFQEPNLRTSIDVRVDSARPARSDDFAPLKVSGTGTYRNAPFDLRGQVDSPLVLRGNASPYQVDLIASAGDTRGRVFGALAEPLQLQDVTVNFELRGPDLARLYEFTGIVLPMTPPYSLKGRLKRRGDRFSYEDFSGTVGDSDLAGNASIDISGKRPRLTAVLKSKVLDFDDLAGFVGGTPGTGEGETASGEQQQAANERRTSGKFLPATSMHFEKLRSMEADVRFTAARVNSRKLPLETMAAHLKLADGQLVVDPLDFGVAGGKLTGIVKVDARKQPAKATIDMQIRDLQLSKLVRNGKLMEGSLGSINGTMALQGQGDSAASVMATSTGNLSAIMGEGQISNLLLEIAGLDIAEALAFLIGGDRQVTVRCAYADFGVVDGIATAHSVALDTTDTALLMRGEASFRDESLDLKLLPRPKDMSPVSVRTPIEIGGTFADPSIAPESEPLLLRGAIVAGLAALAPPLALLGLIETGPGKDLACGPLAPAHEKHRKKPKRAPGPKSVS